MLLHRVSFLWTRQLKFTSIIPLLLITFGQHSKSSFDIGELEHSICPEEGFFPDPHSCTKFYRCVETFDLFYAYEFICPHRTVFDPDIKVCNHPYAVHPNYRCFITNLFHHKFKPHKHIIHVLNDSVLHKFVNVNEPDIDHQQND